MKPHGEVKKNKGKKWKKGHSSDSNPEIKKHRTAAKGKFFNQNQGPSNLTIEALAKHDATEIDADGDAILSDGADTQSQGGRTFNTWASNWTDCTNTTFNRVHRYWNSNSALHKEILAVLAAVTEVIKDQGGEDTETEYFGALMTALESVDNEMSLAAITYLLSLAVKRVPASVFKLRFSEISKSLLDVMAKNANSDTPSLLRSVVACLASVLRVQDQAMWSRSSTMRVYDALLSFVTHPKPKVRRAVHQAVRIVLKTSTFMTLPDPPPHHPAAGPTAKHCIHIIEKNGGGENASSTLQSLELLKYVLAVFPPTSLKSACETILRVMTLSHVVITSVSMRVLHSMFTMHPKATNMPAELNAQIITALYDYEPGENDLQPMAAWLAVMEAAHINLAKLDPRLCSRYLPRIFSAAMKCLQTDRTEVAQAAAKCLVRLLKECVGPEAEQLSVGHMKASSPANKMFGAMEKGLGYQYQASWRLVLEVMESFFEVFSAHCGGLMNKCLLSMADLRDSYGFPYKQELDKAVGMAVRRMGPRAVLIAIPLQITGDDDNYQFPRSWLLPIIRDFTQETELAFFATYFLPLAVKLRSRAIECEAAGETVKAKTYEALQLQIWSLLPGFCTHPTDLKDSLKGVAKILGSALTDRPDLRMDVMTALRRLINQNLEHAENRAELSRFAKNFLPLLFNLFTTKPHDSRDMTRQAVLETIKTYLQIADKPLTTSFFKKAHGKLKEENVSTFRRHALMDITIAMVAYIQEVELEQLYALVVQHLESTDHTVQKKAYRVLEEVCAGRSQQNKAFVASHLGELQEALLKSLSSSRPSSKAPRLRCLVFIFKQLETEQLDFLRAVLPEAILCTKETAEKARSAAYTLLIEMGDAHQRWSGKETKEAVLDYFELLLAGLAGSPFMISATTNALTRIIYEYKANMSTLVLDTMVDNVCVLLGSCTREIVQSVLGLLKVLLSVFTDAVLAQYLKQMVGALTGMKEDTRRHFRVKHREIFIKLCRKFGFETIVKMVPPSYHKLMANIRKVQTRTKKKATKDAGDEDEEDYVIKPKMESIDDLLRDTDSELEEDGDKPRGQGQKKVKGKTRKQTQGAWLKEGDDGDVIDFLDQSVAKKVLATKPSQEKCHTKVKHDFKLAPDGRMIISLGEEDDEGKGAKGSKIKKRDRDEEMDDLNDLMDTLQGPTKKGRKRRMSDSMDLDNEEATEPMKYKAGGSGIHRPLASAVKKVKKEQPRDPGSEFKSKKAGGDIKKKNQPNPYAYVPLHHSALNKRKKKRLEGQFTNLVKGAKKGAAKGHKIGSKARKK